MAKFQVDVPEGFESEESARPQFSFRDSEAVDVGEEASVAEETPREKSLANAIGLLMQAHESLQGADTQLFTLANFLSDLKTNDVSMQGNEGIGRKMIDNIRGALIACLLTFEGTLMTIELEEQGRLGTKEDNREWARAALRIVERTREEYARWGIEGPAQGLPLEMEEKLRAAIALMEEEAAAE